MNFERFRTSTTEQDEPAGMPLPLAALWWAKKGEWERAHATAQADGTAEGAWVHAYLHRVEGDLDNAAYWYGQAGRTPATGPLDEEWEAIAASLLASTASA